jgi:hypothetical protein
MGMGEEEAVKKVATASRRWGGKARRIEHTLLSDS